MHFTVGGLKKKSWHRNSAGEEMCNVHGFLGTWDFFCDYSGFKTCVNFFCKVKHPILNNLRYFKAYPYLQSVVPSLQCRK